MADHGQWIHYMHVSYLRISGLPDALRLCHNIAYSPRPEPVMYIFLP
jgi:hypothetical protein